MKSSLKKIAFTILFSSIAVISTASYCYAEEKPSVEAASIRKNKETGLNPYAHNYTGLIIMIKPGENFHGRMSPRIVSESGVSVYCNMDGLNEEQFNYLINNGIAIFSDNIESAKKRSGENPMIVEAESVLGGDTAIIDDNIARNILMENSLSQFLSKFKVSFVQIN